MKIGSEFEAQMSTVQAISNATTSDLDKLKEKAKQMGADTVFSATEAGQAMEYMAMAGWKTSDMLGGIEGIMHLAAASGEDLATTSDIVTDALTAFKMNAEDATHFSDILAATATNSNTNVAMMGETFKYVAPVAGSLGYSAEDAALAIGLMANSGIKASNAGTALRSIITRMAKPTKESGQAMDDLGLSLVDSSGKMKTFSDVMYDIREGFEKLTEVEKAEYAAMLAGKTGMSGLLAIVNASNNDLEKLFSSIENCNGAAEKMADIRLNNLKGDVEALSGEAETLGLKVYEQLSGKLRALVQLAEKEVGEISASFPTIRRNVIELGDSLSYLYGPVVNLGEWLFDHPSVIASSISGIGVSLTTYKVVSGVMKLGSALSALSPAGAAIIGVAGAGTVISGIATHTVLANKELKKQNLEKHFGKISLSLEDLKEVADSIIRTDSLGQIEESVKAIDGMGEYSNIIEGALEELNRVNWKVSVGMDLSESDKQAYKENITSYIANVQNLVKQKQYAVNLSVGALLTDDEMEESNVIDKINSFYADKEAELESLGKKLNEAVTNAFKDGLLDMDEAKEITELQQQMADIQSAVASSKFDAQLELLNIQYSAGELDAESFQNLQDEINTQLEAAKSNYEESFTLSVSNANVMLEDGAINQEEYDQMVEKLKKGYLENIGALEIKANNFETNTIKQQYADEIAALEPQLQATVNNALNQVIDGINNGGLGADKIAWGKVLSQVQNTEGIDDVTKAAILDLYSLLQPNVERLVELQNQYKQYGMKIPESISDGLNDAAELGTIAGDVDSIWSYVGQSVATSSELSSALESAANTGKYIPEQVGAGILANKTAVDESIDSFRLHVQGKINSAFSNGFNVSVPLNVQTSQSSLLANLQNGIPGHEEGGIFNKPHIAWFAEGGDSEAAIPINSSERSASLWAKTGELLGMLNNSEPTNYGTMASSIGNTGNSTTYNDSTQAMNITYSPNIIVQGNASREEILTAEEDAQEKFNRMMTVWQRENLRTSFK